ncbi:hypothetical protein EMIHUDRAFT_461892 [Emiliania huxleyi CCMP1516]|uniref:Uncharacterized protein n=2 Tax=Emiliania huxleyi TaxID=2903 RepID=A0A0D3I7K9_EMIH1|nr:hypothetical protein EMIHUDRAFT_461892 [Emiliania huxleyi CCMP1516]EOD07244.1 hypothetical protein EMIHUDRAFT_461892 [Emiliania huxleyi CCMP1516]|eukprot:XP_005759673.1 hypothetical protein EMIHUDRAFT_461892 [Emiliania huxleyi CCMP1516]
MRPHASARRRGVRHAELLAATYAALARIEREAGGKAGVAALEGATIASPMARRVLGERLARRLLLRAPLVYGVSGYSVTVGRGVHPNQSWPRVLDGLLRPAYEGAGGSFELRSAAMGALPSFPTGWCLGELLGDPDVVTWQFSMNEPVRGGARCNRASEAFARAALGMHSQPLFLLVDDNARRTASLSRAFEASGAHAIVPSRLLPLRGALAPWNETAAQMKAQECPRECRVGSWHPGPRHHRTVAWAIAQLHLSEVANALWRWREARSWGNATRGDALAVPPVCSAEAPWRAPFPITGCATALVTPDTHTGRKGLARYASPRLVWSGALVLRNGSWPGAPPPFAWVETSQPSAHAAAALARMRRCGNDYGDHKASGWLSLALPIKQSRCRQAIVCEAPVVSGSKPVGLVGTQAQLAGPEVHALLTHAHRAFH